MKHTDTSRLLSLTFSWTILSLVLLIGLLAGVLVGSSRHRPSLPITMVDSPVEAAVPVVRIDGIRNGALIGLVEGSVRLFAGQKMVDTSGSGTFAIKDAALLTNVITVRTPAGMRFIASKRGKKYYSVDSASGQRIVPENRVYFASKEAAEKAGFVP